MEHLGSHYAVLLHEPQLRKTMIPTPEPAGSRGRESSAAVRLRIRLALSLHGLAARIAPTPSTRTTLGARSPAPSA